MPVFLEVEQFLAENGSPSPDTLNYYVPPLHMPLSTNFFNQYILANTLKLLNYKVSKAKKKSKM